MRPETLIESMADLVAEDIIEAPAEQFLIEFHQDCPNGDLLLSEVRETVTSVLGKAGSERLRLARVALEADHDQLSLRNLQQMPFDEKIHAFASLVQKYPEIMTAHRNLETASDEDLDQLLLDAQELGYDLEELFRKDSD